LTPDAIGVIIALAGTVVTMLGGMGALFAWAWGRFDKRFEQVGARFDRVDAELADIRGDVVQLQVAVARLEGPHRSLALR